MLTTNIPLLSSNVPPLQHLQMEYHRCMENCRQKLLQNQSIKLWCIYTNNRLEIALLITSITVCSINYFYISTFIISHTYSA